MIRRMGRRTRVHLSGACIFALGAAALRGQQRGDGSLVEGELGKAVQATTEKLAPELRGCVLLAEAGKVVFARGFGNSDLMRTPVTPKSLFDLGGLAMHFTAAAALRLCADGKLALTDPVGRHLPDWPADKAAITVAHLLEHRSGLPDAAAWVEGEAGSLRTAVARFARTRLATPVGEVHFSILDAGVLAAVVETVAKQRFEEFVRQRLLRPAGLLDSGCLGDRKLDDKRALLRRAANGRFEPMQAFEWNWAHKGVVGLAATALDLHAWCDALTAGQALPAKETELLLRPVSGGGVFTVTTMDLGGDQLLLLQGATVGFQSWLLLQPKLRCWIVLLGDDRAPLAQLGPALAGLLVADLRRSAGTEAATPAPGPAPTGLPGPAGASAGASAGTGPARFVGRFQLPYGGQLEITAGNDGLLLVGEGLQASARVLYGTWPAGEREAVLRRCEDRGLVCLQALGSGGAAGVLFATADAAAQATAVFQGLLQQHGAFARVELIGTQQGAGETSSWFRATFGSAAVVLRATWGDARKFAALAVTDTPHPFRVPLRVLQPDVAVAKGAGGHLLLTVEGRDLERVLVFEDATPGAGGLLEAPAIR